MLPPRLIRRLVLAPLAAGHAIPGGLLFTPPAVSPPIVPLPCRPVLRLPSASGPRPRVVMKASLQLGARVDVAANRLPNVFIQRARTGERVFVDQIERLARGLEPGGALVIFPEGGNWTPNRWERGILRLEQRGRRGPAARAPGRTSPLAPPRAGAFPSVE